MNIFSPDIVLFYYIYLFGMGVDNIVCEGERTTQELVFSVTLWILGIELRYLGLEVSTSFAC